MSRACAVVCSMCRVPPGCRMSDGFITALDQRQLRHQEDRMTSQLNHLIAQQRQAELDELVEGMYDRGLATEEPRPAPPHAGPLAEAPGYPPLCAHGMNSLTDRGYDHALARLHAAHRRTAAANPHTSSNGTTHVPIPVSPTDAREARAASPACWRAIEPHAERSQGVAARAQPRPCHTTALRAVERNLS